MLAILLSQNMFRFWWLMIMAFLWEISWYVVKIQGWNRTVSIVQVVCSWYKFTSLLFQLVFDGLQRGAFLTSTCVKELLLPIACSGTPPKANIAEVLSSFSCFTLKLPFAVICIYFHQLTKHGTFVSFSCKPQLLAVWLSMLESVSFLSSCSAFWGASIALSTRTFKKNSMSSGEATHTKPCFWVWWKF